MAFDFRLKKKNQQKKTTERKSVLWVGDSKKGEFFCGYSALSEKGSFCLRGEPTLGSNKQAEGGWLSEGKAFLAAC